MQNLSYLLKRHIHQVVHDDRLLVLGCKTVDGGPEHFFVGRGENPLVRRGSRHRLVICKFVHVTGVCLANLSCSCIIQGEINKDSTNPREKIAFLCVVFRHIANCTLYCPRN